MKNKTEKAAALLGRTGGQATLKKHGKKHFKLMAKASAKSRAEVAK